ncbi:MAG: C4-type zinc ribbon domain-containing protein [Propionibacteriaceae bacterium]|nr:C4-type zinc ribbon domain-containing protein [Propionibacteriaceae bacterium]
MQARPAIQALLVTLADLDNASTVVQRRAKALPEHAELVELNTQRVATSEQIVAVQTQISDTNAELERRNDDLEVARTRLARDQQRLDDGVVNEQKQIAGLQSEIEHLSGRISVLEDESLELMQVVEDGEAKVAELTATRTGLEDRMRALIASRDDQMRQAEQELAGLTQRRTGLVEQIPADVLALYTKVAARLGTGAAELRNGRCSGCGLQLDAAAVRAAAEADASTILRCDECGRILVRTASA